MKKKILKRSILSFLLSLSLVVSPLASVEMVASAETETTVVEQVSEDAAVLQADAAYYIVMDATGDTTTVDTSTLVTNSKITGYQVTTSKDGKLVDQKVVTAAPTSVDTTGADKLEIAPVYYHAIGVAGELGKAGYDIALPAGTYDFTVYNTTSRCDVYANDQMLVNNLLQYGTTPNYFVAKDIVIKEDNIRISTTDYTSGQSANNMNISVQVVKSPSIVDRAQKIYVFGDSLVAMYYNGGSKDNNVQTGWGQVLHHYIVDSVDVVDMGNSGVTAVGLYNSAFSLIKGSAQEGDILLLESGYNDPNYNTKTKEEMEAVVTAMVTESEALGVEVILVSPNTSPHSYGSSIAWTDVMEKVAEAEDVTYVDLCQLSYDFYHETYKDDKVPMEATYVVSDRLHSTYKGAQKWASLVAKSLYDQGYTDLIDTSYGFAFTDTLGNIIACSATDKTIEGYAKVTFDMNGQAVDNLYTLVEANSTVSKPVDPAASGYKFGGWYKDAACEEAWNFATDTVATDTTLYALWIENEAGVFYSQDFTGVTDASTVAKSNNAQDKMTIASDDTHGNYLSFSFAGDDKTNSRGGYMDFTGLDISGEDTYIIEFDAAITPGNKDATYFTLKESNLAYNNKNMNEGAASGYLMNIVNGGTSGTKYTINGIDTAKVTIPSGEWCHYTIYVNKPYGLFSTTITGSTVVADKLISSFDGTGDVNGIYMLAGRYQAVHLVDNIVVREATEYDDFGELPEEVLAKAEFTSGLGTVITQPAEGSAVHYPITVKGVGSLGTDLADQSTIKWSVVGLEEEDGYISLTKEEGTGAGTDGEAPDGKTAYFNVRNGVSNYFGYVQAEVTYGKDTHIIKTPFAVIGANSSNEKQLAPAAGYYVNMNDYADSLVGYKGTVFGMNDKDLVLNNWTMYGSNGDRGMELVQDEDGTKSIKLGAASGSGSTVAVYQWAEQKEQYVIDFTAKFTGAMDFGVYTLTPNNSGNNPEWAASYASGTLTLGTGTISGIEANEWYRYVVSADASVQKVSLTVYNSAGAKIGEINDIDMTNDSSVQKFFCFYKSGTWTMYLNSFEAYKPTVSSMVVASSADVVKVPEAGEAASTVDISATLTSADGIKITGAVEWSLAEEYANVEIASTGTQTATLTIGEGASGAVTVLATKDGKQAEVTIQLTTSSNVVAFKESTSSITIPFNGEEAVVAPFVAETRDGDGNAIEGGTITYTLLAKDGVTETTVNGVTFENGVLTVAAGASPAVVYVKATNEEGLSSKVKVNIHGLSFAFGSGEAADGYTQVVDALYTDKLGYGFNSTDGLTVNESNVTGTSDFRFKAKVPNGNYNVTVNTTAASMTSEVVESVSATTGISKSGSTFSVAVCDGVLDLTFPAASAVTSIEISQATAKTRLSAPMIYSIGDSTTSNNANTALSWGNCVANGLVEVPEMFSGYANHGMAGRDSVNFYNQARVEAVLLAICPGDYVTVNMGINSKETGEAASYYTLVSEYYVEGILQRGGIPVIVTATPDGPVGDRVSGNYDSTTGKFTNNRGNGARNDALRQIAEEKELQIIELGQWGEDWMNTLTADDVTAYNTEFGTAFTTVLEMVQSWYVDHNHYREYLGVQIANYIFDELEGFYEENYVEVTAVEMAQAEANVKAAATTTLKVIVTPEDATQQAMTWTSSDEDVATVKDGVVTGVAVGTATITATSVNGLTTTCTVTVTPAAVLLDVEEGAWYYEYTNYVFAKGLMSGTSTDENGDANFEPNKQLSREMLAQILFAAEGKPAITTDKAFPDLVEGAWYVNAVLWAAENEIVTGYDTGNFGVGDNITREQLALMLYKYATIKGYDTSASTELEGFIDVTDVHDWAATGMKWAVANGIMSGKTAPDGVSLMLAPQGEATRAECATMLTAFMKKYVDGVTAAE